MLGPPTSGPKRTNNPSPGTASENKRTVTAKGWIRLPRARPYISELSWSSLSRSTLAGFIDPCLPSPADKPPFGRGMDSRDQT